jgi:hypothetical protein
MEQCLMSGVVVEVLGEAMVTVGGLWCAKLDLVLYGTGQWW